MCCSVLQWQRNAAVISDMRVLQCVLPYVAMCCMQPSRLTYVCCSVRYYVLQCVAVAVRCSRDI